MKHRNSIVLKEDDILEACMLYLNKINIKLPDKCIWFISKDENTGKYEVEFVRYEEDIREIFKQ